MPQGSRWIRAAPLVVALLSVAACGSAPLESDGAGAPGTSQAQASMPPDGSASQPIGGGAGIEACTLLENAEIEAALGLPVLSSESAFEGQCQWTVDDASADLPTIFVEVTSPGGRERWEILAGQMPVVEVAGGEAYQQGDSVWAVEGDTLLKLSWFSGTVEQMVPLVEAALGRLR